MFTVLTCFSGFTQLLILPVYWSHWIYCFNNFTTNTHSTCFTCISGFTYFTGIIFCVDLPVFPFDLAYWLYRFTSYTSLTLWTFIPWNQFIALWGMRLHYMDVVPMKIPKSASIGSKSTAIFMNYWWRCIGMGLHLQSSKLVYTSSQSVPK